MIAERKKAALAGAVAVGCVKRTNLPLDVMVRFTRPTDYSSAVLK